jgi:hypothetical protein
MPRVSAILWRPVWLHHIFRHYYIKGTNLGKKLLNIKSLFLYTLQLFFETFLILRRISEILSYMWKRFLVKYPLFLSDFNETWIFSTNFRKSLKYQISLKYVQWEPSCSMRTDKQICGYDDTNRRFSQFCEHSKWNHDTLWNMQIIYTM